MPVYLLNESKEMPSPEGSNSEGLVAIGGDLSVERLINAYKSGIFPWFEEGSDIMWWSPDPRLVLFPAELKISKSMRQLFNKNAFTVTFNKNFKEVIDQCKIVDRINQDGTWITNDMVEAYIELNRIGIAQSVEVWKNDLLVGGLYGIRLGDVFFGESMFTKVSNASKFGFIKMVETLSNDGVKLIDCQLKTDHLVSLGAREIERKLFLELLENEL